MHNNYSIEDFKELLDLLAQDAGEEIDAYVSLNRLFVRSPNTSLDLMLRFSDNEIFTIARIEVVNQRAGVGQEILSWCSEFARSRGYQYLEFEAVLTEEMINFCLKNNFYLKTKDNREKSWIKKL